MLCVNGFNFMYAERKGEGKGVEKVKSPREKKGMERTFENGVELIRTHRSFAVVSVMIILMTYGTFAATYVTQWDSIETIGDYPKNLLWWLQLGRFSLAAMKKIFENGYLNITFSNSMMLAVLYIVVLFYGLMFRLRRKYTGWFSEAELIIFTLMFVTVPMMLQQYCFTLQVWELLSGYLTALLASECFLRSEKKRIFLLPAILLLTWTIGIYQALCTVFVFCVFAGLLTEQITAEEQQHKVQLSVRRCLDFIMRFFILIAGTGILYFAVNRILRTIFKFGDAGYLGNYIKWLGRPFSQSVYEILHQIKQVIFSNDNIYVSRVYGVIIIVFLLGAFLGTQRIYSLMLRIMIAASPFLFQVLVGGAVLLRMQIGFAPALAFECVCIVNDMGRFHSEKEETAGHLAGRIPGCIALILIFVFGIRSMQNVHQAIRAEQTAFSFDEQKIYAIHDKIRENKATKGLQRVIFLGISDDALRLQKGAAVEDVGTDIFQISDGPAASGYYRSCTITWLAEMMGLPYTDITYEEYIPLLKKYMPDKTTTLPVYPDDGCVIVDRNTIVVIMGQSTN